MFSPIIKKKLFFLGVLFSVSSCTKELKKYPEDIHTNQTFSEVLLQDIPTINFEDLKSILNKQDTITYVVNFWATWCLPCVKELPYFENIHQQYKDKNVEVILVSLDFMSQKEKRLIPFINKKKLQSTIIHFNDVNDQIWIPEIDKNWSGAIPATLIYNNNKRKFYEQSFTEKELQKEIRSFIEL